MSLSSTTVAVNSRFGVGADALPVVGPDTVTTGGVLVGVGGGVGDGDGVEGVGSGVLVAEAAGSLITTASQPAGYGREYIHDLNRRMLFRKPAVDLADRWIGD